MIEFLFWLCAVGAVYSYFLYPAVLRCLPVRRRVLQGQPPLAGDALPRISLIVTAHNEQSRIERKLENTLALDYPHDRLQVIVDLPGVSREDIQIRVKANALKLSPWHVPANITSRSIWTSGQG